MLVFAQKSDVGRTPVIPSDEEATLVRIEERLPPLLSVIAGMVDLTGFFMLGNIFTAHITGNLVSASAVVVRGGAMNPAQLLAIPVFMGALAVVWLIARRSNRNGPALVRLLLLVQFLLLAAVLVLCVATKPSSNPHGVLAGVAALIAVSAMACQYALLRLAMPRAISTAVMTGNLTNTVLSIMDALSNGHPLMSADDGRLRRSLHLLFGFLLGCMIAAMAISTMGDWAWSLPAVLAGAAVVRP
ncbi:DUF1275 family protein [Bradyrhizobium sp. Tv2a-2]|jgi:uncharacterized membrane protein YoaK (UPF0700 family)|uniref:DUF1275 family protein n=1 Tax=Bradyrhizobium sp. Tv2a-2 TaxID=113395 RepID=UPI000429A9A0|nr:DUF1275 family protein [Bradyrhizobium sp. Tv2a-2]